MREKKIKMLVTLTIIFSLVLSQAAMASSLQTAAPETVSAATATVTAAAAESQTNQDSIKTKISKEEAIKIIKAFKFAEGYDVSNIYLDNNGNIDNPTWRMDLYTQQYSSNASVSISANTGELLNYNSWLQQNRKNIVSITKTKAKEIAEKFIADNVKTVNKTLEYVPNQYDTYERTGGVYEIPQYNFTYALKVNGIISNDATYNISVNAANGTVINFYSSNQYTSERKYPSTDGLKDMEQLKSKYIGLIKMQPQYIINYYNEKPEVFLAYMPSTPALLDAKTMESVTDYIYIGNSTPKPVDTSLIKEVENKEITEEKALETINSAKAYIEKLTGITFKESQGVSIRMGADEKDFNKNYDYLNGNIRYRLSISINLRTGNINSFDLYQYSEYNGEKPKDVTEKVSYNDAKKISDELIKNLFIKQYGAYSDINQEPDSSDKYVKQQQTHNFQYSRYVNGIPAGNTINVSINKETGKLENLYMNWYDINYPKADNIISADKAKEIYLKDLKFGFEYYSPYIYSGGSVEKAQETLIVFKPVNTNMGNCVDAVKGVITDFSGKPITAVYSDANHWAADSIEMLETQGVVFRNLSSYDQKLSRQDAVKMLSLITGIQFFSPQNKDSFTDVKKDSEYYKYIESAVQNNIIQATGKKFNGEEKITKGEFITMLVDMLGYKDIVKHDELFAKSSDSSKDIYISICKAFDILPLKSGETFKEGDTITFAEAAYSLQKALRYIR